MRKMASLIAAVLVLAAAPAFASDLSCRGAAGNIEQFRYEWRLKGGLGWLAGFVIPNDGIATLRTEFPTAGTQFISSELLITAPEGKSGGHYLYESEMDPNGARTTKTVSGYAWGSKAREERITLDYEKRLARIYKRTPEKTENKVKPLPPGAMRDVLTAIYYLRQHSTRITKPLTTKVYSEGKEYPVVFRPLDGKTFNFEGKRTSARGFEIVDAPGGKEWPGTVRVYVSDDDRRIPFRIEITRSMATLQLDLEKVEACGFMQAYARR